MHFGSIVKAIGNSKNLDFHGDGYKGWAKPTTVRTAKKIARRARRRSMKVKYNID